tara:strand:- start:124 stop:1857 length:1734 start_codon:yes stop_codon:yes gene_type:complete
MIKNSAALQRKIARGGKKLLEVLLESTTSKGDEKPPIYNKTGYSSSLEEVTDTKGYYTASEREKGIDKTLRLSGYYNPKVSKSGIKNLTKKIKSVATRVDNKKEKDAMLSLASDLNKSVTKQKKSWEKDSSFLGQFFDSSAFTDITKKGRGVQDVLFETDDTPTMADFKQAAKIFNQEDFVAAAQKDASIRKIYNTELRKRNPNELNVNLRDIKEIALNKINQLAPSKTKEIIDVLNMPADDVGFTGTSKGGRELRYPKQYIGKDDIITYRTKEDKPALATKDNPVGFTPEYYIPSAGDPSEFNRPEIIGNTLREMEKADRDAIRRSEPNLLDTQSTQIKQRGLTLPKDMTPTQLKNLSLEERRFIEQAQDIYNETYIEAQQKGFNKRDSDAIAQEEIVAVMFGRAEDTDSISGSVLKPDDVLARKYKSSITGRKKGLLPEEKPEYFKGEQRSLFGEKQYPITGRFTTGNIKDFPSPVRSTNYSKKTFPQGPKSIQSSASSLLENPDSFVGNEILRLYKDILMKKRGLAKGGLASLKKKKKRKIPKILKNKSLRARKENKKPKGVGQALRGFGAISG